MTWQPGIAPQQQPSFPGGPPKPGWSPVRQAICWTLIGLAGIGALAAILVFTHAGSGIFSHGSVSAAPTSPSVIESFTGSGDSNTPSFTVGATWKVSYTFDCSGFGRPGNFQVTEDGGKDYALTINDLAESKTAETYAYDDAGTHYLQILSECAWSVTVTG